MTESDIDRVRVALADLTEAMGWGPLQTARNMLLALTARVGAVAAHLQFTPDAGPDADQVNAELRGDLADCLVYLVALSDALAVQVADEAVDRLRAALASKRA